MARTGSAELFTGSGGVFPPATVFPGFRRGSEVISCHFPFGFLVTGCSAMVLVFVNLGLLVPGKRYPKAGGEDLYGPSDTH